MDITLNQLLTPCLSFLGTIVDSVMIGSIRNKINSHEELLDMHEEADKKPTKSLRLVFINTEILPRSDTTPALPDKDWTSTGAWQGKLNCGWPGGADAKVNGMRSKFASPPRFVHAASRDRGSFSDQHLVAENGFAANKSRTVLLQHQAARPSSSLRTLPRRKKSVKFNLKNQERIFDAEEVTTAWVVEPLQRHGEKNLGRIVDVPSASESPEKAIADVVQHRTYTDLINVLEAGCACNCDIAVVKLRDYSYQVEEALRSVEHGLMNNPSDSLLQSSKDDLVAKKDILRMYIHFCIHIENTISLQYRASFEVRIRRLSIRKSSNVRVRGRSDVTTGDVNIRIHNANEVLGVEDKVLVSSTQGSI
jgi:hypothetical protein